MKNLLLTCLLHALFKLTFSQPAIGIQSYVTGLSSPVDIANCGDDRLFIVERDGTIRIIDGQGIIKPQVFLDINGVVRSGGEEGLLGLAFHPDYKINGFFFVYYTNNNGDISVSRFSVTADPDIADASTEVNVITIGHPGRSNHNGGNLEFGPDGYLYIGTGDGGGGGDPDDNGQNPLALLGKMLRLDVDTLPYRIPADNPFYGFASVRNEIWALGLRNPWRFSFDRLTGDLWIGDVGQNNREEIDFQAAGSAGGENYGWRCYEGNNFYNSSSFGCNGNYVYPVFDYGHGSGCSVNGGYVYRGCKYPDFFGHYILCDYCTGAFWTIQNNGGGNFQATSQPTTGSDYSSFGEDMNGEIYLARLNGTIYRVIETTTTASLPTIIANPDTSLCPGDSLTLSTQNGFASYDWTLNSSTPAGSGLQITANTPGNYTLTTTGLNGCIYTTPATTITNLPSPSPTITAADSAFCENDSLLLSTGVFSAYQWSNGSTASSTFAKQGGAFNITVIDSSGCAGASAPFVAVEYSLPVPVIHQTGGLCNGNTVTLSTDAYAYYLWSTSDTTPSITVDTAGVYSITVTDINSCSGNSQPFTLSDGQLPAPMIYSSGGSTICEGDSTDLFTAVAGVTHLWSTGDTGDVLKVTLAGDYSVIITDGNGCTGVSDTLAISTSPLPVPVIVPDEFLVCDGDSATLSIDASFSQYSWSSGETGAQITVSDAGKYNVTVQDGNGCFGVSDSATLSLYPNPPIPTVSEQQGEPILSVSETGYSYQWYLNGSAIQNANGQSITYTDYAAQGEFSASVTDSNGCSSLSNPVAVSWTGMEETWLRNLSIQPNPFTSEIALNYTLIHQAYLKVLLLDITGKEISVITDEKQSAGFHKVTINANTFNLSEGIYFLRLEDGTLRKNTFKIVKM